MLRGNMNINSHRNQTKSAMVICFSFLGIVACAPTHSINRYPDHSVISNHGGGNIVQTIFH